MTWLDLVSGIGLPMLGYAIRVLVGIRTDMAALRVSVEGNGVRISDISKKVENHEKRIIILETANNEQL